MSYQDFEVAAAEAMHFTDLSNPDQDVYNLDLADETSDRFQADCKSFWYRARCYFDAGEIDDKQAGHDFWLTRNGHGAGFWDGDVKEPYGEMLTKIANSYGPFELYTGDDGTVYAA